MGISVRIVGLYQFVSILPSLTYKDYSDFFMRENFLYRNFRNLYIDLTNFFYWYNV